MDSGKGRGEGEGKGGIWRAIVGVGGEAYVCLVWLDGYRTGVGKSYVDEWMGRWGKARKGGKTKEKELLFSKRLFFSSQFLSLSPSRRLEGIPESPEPYLL